MNLGEKNSCQFELRKGRGCLLDDILIGEVSGSGQILSITGFNAGTSRPLLTIASAGADRFTSASNFIPAEPPANAGYMVLGLTISLYQPFSKMQ